MPDNHLPPSHPRNFNEPLHLMRGMLIVLVVAGHTITAAYPDSEAAWARGMHRAIYSFHMHAFFFLSGYLGRKFFLAERGQVGSIALNQIKRLGVVYLFYSVIGIVMKLGAPSDLLHRPIRVQDVVADVLLYPQLNPLLPLWFLYVLLAIELAFVLARGFLRVNFTSTPVAVSVLVLLVAANFACRGTPLDAIFGWTLAGRYAVYFFLGFLIGQRGAPVEDWLRKYRAAMLTAGVMYFVWMLAYQPAIKFAPAALGCALAGTAFCWTLAIHLSLRASAGKSLISMLADYAYEIYTNSGVVQAVTRIVVQKALPRLLPGAAGLIPPTLLVASIVLGLLVPILLTRHLYRRNVWLRRLAMGEWRQTAPARTTP